MNVTDFLDNIIGQGAQLWVEDENLRCRGPKHVITKEALHILKEHKPEIIKLIKMRGPLMSESLPLTSAQLAIWNAWKASPDNAAYNVNAVVSVSRDIDTDILNKALNFIIRRHAGLACTFSALEGMPEQTIRHDLNPNFNIVPFSNHNWLDDSIERFIDQPFDLENELPIRLNIYIPDASLESDAFLVFVLHHIASDFWGAGIFLDELMKAYQFLKEDKLPNFSDLTLSLKDIVTQENRLLNDLSRQPMWSYWESVLSDPPERLSLPSEMRRPKVMTYNGESFSSNILNSDVGKIRALSKDLNTTPYVVLLTLYQVLLSRISGQSEIFIGAPTAGRNHLGSEGMIGNFVNLLVLRMSLSQNEDFITTIRHNKNNLQQALLHQQAPYIELVKRFLKQRDPAFAPFFDVVFNWNKVTAQSGNNREHKNGDLLKAFIRGSSTGNAGATHDLALSIVEHGDELKCLWTFNTDIFLPDTVKMFAKCFDLMLAGVLKSPSMRLGEIPLISDKNEISVSEKLAKGNVFPLNDLCIDQRIDDAIKQYPNHIALQESNRTVKYSELGQYVNRLASYLKESYLGADSINGNSIVAVCLPRSIDFVMCCLGIMRAGSAYLPIDPALPAERIAGICHDAKIAVLIANQDSIVKVQQAYDGKQITLESVAGSLEDFSADMPEFARSANGLAYVIYTSGSTGLPKGVTVTHRSLGNLVDWHNRVYSLNSDTVAAQTAAVGFDACVWEIWPYLCAGSKINIVPDECIQEPGKIPEFLSSHYVTHCFLPTPLYEAIPEVCWQNNQTLSYLLVGGDALRKNLRHEKIKLINHYGPTENTVVATAGPVKPEPLGSLPDIGCAIDNNQVMVLDDAFNLVPVGVIGELYISGSSLARDYLNDPGRTAEKFLPCPYASNAGGRMYRTGDFARYLSSGKIEFLGRRDRQVKLRGYRIELNEIACIMQKQPNVQEASVVVDADNHVQRLIAFVVMPQTDFDAEALMQSLRAELPVYMVPSSIERLDSMPLTPNGKVNIAILQDLARQQHPSEKLKPKNKAEETLLNLWCNVLGLQDIGVTDNFFELGGHSLLAAQLTDRIRHELSVDLSINTLLQNPNIRDLSLAIEKGEATDNKSVSPQNVIVIEPDIESLHKSFPLTDTQYAYWIGRAENIELGNTATHIYTEVEFSEYDEVETDAIWNKLIKRHHMLRMIVSMDGQQKILETVPDYVIHIDDLSNLSEDEREACLQETREHMSHQVFDPQRWPLFEIRVSKLNDKCFRLHTSIDGLIADARSFNIINYEYYMIAAKRDDELPEISISFRDYILAERRLRDSGLYQKSREYWLKQLDALPEAPRLPLACDPRRISQPKFKRYQGTMDADKWNAIKQRAKSLNSTASVVLMNAFSEVLAAWSEDVNFTLNLTLFNRLPLHQDVEHLVGDFTSLTLLEMNMDSNLTFAELVQTHQKRLWTDLEHRYFTGVESLRELTRRANHWRQTMMPVVFTSILPLEHQDSSGLQDLPEFDEGKDIYTITQTSQVWIDHVVSEKNGVLSFTWDVVEELFPAGLIDDMFDTYCRLIEALSADSDWNKSYRPGMPAHQIETRNTVNATEADYSDHLIFSGFVKQALSSPDRIAIRCHELEINYAQLYSYASSLAQQLRKQDIKPGDAVAVVMRKSWQQVVAVLGITMSGGAYLPVDASLPEARRRQLLEQGQVRVIVISKADQPELLETSDYITLMADSDETLAGDTQPDIINTQTDLAYIIFTSGTTGVPKGVMIDHRGAVNTIEDINERFSVSGEDRALALSALSFDLSVYDIFGLLAMGGQIVLPSNSDVRNPELWGEYLAKYDVTVINAVPSFLQMLVDYAEAVKAFCLPKLRLVMMSGDWIPVPLPDRIRKIAPKADVFSLGGATEASIWSIYYPINEVNYAWPSIPYGKPLRNQGYHVLRSDLSDCPDWVPGELYISGIGLAVGYFNDREKTEKSFIVHPESGIRLYRTGDVGRYMPDGHIEFMGRADTQVKVQGHRIELSEIETHLLQNSLIRDAVVDAKGEGRNRALYAYVVAKTGTELDEASSQENASIIDYVPDSVQSNDRYQLIENPLERMLFKFAHHGIRSLDEHNDDIKLETIKAFADAKAHRANEIDIPFLSTLLAVFKAEQVGNNPLPKFLYPSAGSLYPVQCYLLIGGDQPLNSSLRPGVYYYHPVKHVLCFLYDADSSATGLCCFLVAEDRAIAPLYGSLSESFTALEAGYMQELIISHAAMNGIKASSSIDGSSSVLQLNGQQRLLTTLSIDLLTEGGMNYPLPDLSSHTLTWRQSYREFEMEAISLEMFNLLLKNTVNAITGFDSLRIVIGVKSNRIHGLNKGWYEYDRRSLKLVKTDASTEYSDLYEGDNAAIALQSGWCLLLCSESSQNADASSLFCGAFGQRLMMLSPEINLGWCPIGYVKQSVLHNIFPELTGYQVLHNFLGGRISDSQKEQWVQIEKPSPESTLSNKLQEWLRERLPEYMLPSQYVWLDKLPLTSNGKVDRRALPLPDAKIMQKRQTFTAAVTDLERKIADIWKSQLALEQIGRDDNFFEIGGNSVMLVQVFGKLQSHITVELQIADLFAYSTVKALADFIEKKQAGGQSDKTLTARADKAKAARRKRQSRAGNRNEKIGA